MYACGPVIKQILECSRWRFVIGVKPDGNKFLFNQFNEKDRQGKINWHSIKEKGETHRFGFINNLILNETACDVRVNMLYYEWTNSKGEVKKFSWCTNIKLMKSNVYKIMCIGRSRWKIENETFNTLKNQGYHFEHNFGHGEKNLCTNFAFLMMLVFYIDQIQQYSCQYFKIILKELKTRSKFWESLELFLKFYLVKTCFMLSFLLLLSIKLGSNNLKWELLVFGAGYGSLAVRYVLSGGE